MTGTGANSEQVIREELEKTATLVSGARRLMAEGRSVDLSALEERVKAVVKALQSAPAEVACGYKEHLQALLGILDILESDLTEQFGALEEALKTLQHRKAMDAYGTKHHGTKDNIE